MIAGRVVAINWKTRHVSCLGIRGKVEELCYIELHGVVIESVISSLNQRVGIVSTPKAQSECVLYKVTEFTTLGMLYSMKVAKKE